MEKLRAENLVKVYRDGDKEILALDKVSLEIEEGALSTIVGPSGSGKSTLLYLLAGLDKPTSGEIYLNGVSFSSLSDEKRAEMRAEKVGFIFQFYHLLPELSILENVCLPLLIKESKKGHFSFSRIIKEAKEKAILLLNQLGIEKKKESRPFQLSGGEEQRAAIARALINQPRFIFCDEPTGNLDEEATENVISLILSLNERGQTFCITTHSEKLGKIGRKRLYLEKGRLV